MYRRRPHHFGFRPDTNLNFRFANRASVPFRGVRNPYWDRNIDHSIMLSRIRSDIRNRNSLNSVNNDLFSNSFADTAGGNIPTSQSEIERLLALQNIVDPIPPTQAEIERLDSLQHMVDGRAQIIERILGILNSDMASSSNFGLSPLDRGLSGIDTTGLSSTQIGENVWNRLGGLEGRRFEQLRVLSPREQGVNLAGQLDFTEGLGAARLGALPIDAAVMGGLRRPGLQNVNAIRADGLRLQVPSDSLNMAGLQGIDATRVAGVGVGRGSIGLSSPRVNVQTDMGPIDLQTLIALEEMRARRQNGVEFIDQHTNPLSISSATPFLAPPPSGLTSVQMNGMSSITSKAPVSGLRDSSLNPFVDGSVIGLPHSTTGLRPSVIDSFISGPTIGLPNKPVNTVSQTVEREVSIQSTNPNNRQGVDFRTISPDTGIVAGQTLLTPDSGMIDRRLNGLLDSSINSKGDPTTIGIKSSSVESFNSKPINSLSNEPVNSVSQTIEREVSIQSTNPNNRQGVDFRTISPDTGIVTGQTLLTPDSGIIDGGLNGILDSSINTMGDPTTIGIKSSSIDSFNSDQTSNLSEGPVNSVSQTTIEREINIHSTNLNNPQGVNLRTSSPDAVIINGETLLTDPSMDGKIMVGPL